MTKSYKTCKSCEHETFDYRWCDASCGEHCDGSFTVVVGYTYYEDAEELEWDACDVYCLGVLIEKAHTWLKKHSHDFNRSYMPSLSIKVSGHLKHLRCSKP